MKGLAGAIEAGFCSYDADAEMVWVFEMAAYQVAEQLAANDNRCAGVQREYNDLPESLHLCGFYEKYASAFHMKTKRDFGSPSEAPSKPLPSQEQEQEQEQEQQQVLAAVPVAAPAQPKKPAEPKKPRKPTKIPLPDGFVLSESVKAWAAAKGHENLQAHFDSFVGKVRANGYCYVDWDQALQNAIRDDWAKLGQKQLPLTGAAGPPARPSRHSGFENLDYSEGIEDGRIT